MPALQNDTQMWIVDCRPEAGSGRREARVVCIPDHDGFQVAPLRPGVHLQGETDMKDICEINLKEKERLWCSSAARTRLASYQF